MADTNVPRRSFLKGAGAAGTLAATALTGALPRTAEAQPAPAAAPTPAPQPEPMLTLTATEQAFLSAVYDTIIPADALSPSGTDCGLVTYIDRQLAGAWGGGARMYRAGPFIQSKPEYGYQLPLTPREYFAEGIKATNAWTTKTYGREFDRLSPADRVATLTAMEQSRAAFDGLDAKPFFEALLQSAMEGFFADPIYGGNRGHAAWKMIGYPGLPANYREAVTTSFGKRYAHAPRSLGDPA
jgi:gluconate 2-dehydrogenase gamma chain